MKKISQKAGVRLLSAIMIITLFLPNFIIPSAAWSGTPLCNQATVYLNSQEVIRMNESYKAISEKFLPSSILCGDMLYLPLELLINCGMDLDYSDDSSSIIINSMKCDTYISASEHKKDEATVRLGSKGTAYLDNVIDIVVAGKKIAKANQTITYNGQTYPSSFWPKEAIYLPVEPILKELGIPVRWDKNTSSLYIGNENNSQSNSMSVSANVISVKKQTSVYVTMAHVPDGVNVTYNILDDGQKYVSVEWGEWEGDRIPLYLTPLRSGTAKIRITNSLNSDFADITAIVEIAEKNEQPDIPSAAWSGKPLCNKVTVYLNGKAVVLPKESYQSTTKIYSPSSILCGKMVYLPLEILKECGISIDFSNDQSSIIIKKVKLQDPVRRCNRKQDTSDVTLGASFLANTIDIVAGGKKIAQVGKEITYNDETYPSSFFVFDGESFYLPVTTILNAFGIYTRWDNQSSSLYLDVLASSLDNVTSDFNGVWLEYDSDVKGKKGEKLNYSVTIDLSSGVTYSNNLDSGWVSKKWELHPQKNKIISYTTDTADSTLELRSDGRIFSTTVFHNNGTTFYTVLEKQTPEIPKSNGDILNERFPKLYSFKSDLFNDVKTSDWFATKVTDVYERDLMNGNGDSTFNPYGNLSYAETLVLASKLHSGYYQNNYVFSSDGLWYQAYLDYALKNNLIETQYKDYSSPISRGEFASILARVFPTEALIGINYIADGAIPDVAKNTSYYDSVYLLYRAGILAGTGSEHIFNPTSNITRAEVATIISNMVNFDSRTRFDLMQ